jgi:hypothetical protein
VAGPYLQLASEVTGTSCTTAALLSGTYYFEVAAFCS